MPDSLAQAQDLVERISRTRRRRSAPLHRRREAPADDLRFHRGRFHRRRPSAPAFTSMRRSEAPRSVRRAVLARFVGDLHLLRQPSHGLLDLPGQFRCKANNSGSVSSRLSCRVPRRSFARGLVPLFPAHEIFAGRAVPRLAVDALFTRKGITREEHRSPRPDPVAVHHLHQGHRRAPVRGGLRGPPELPGPFAVPRMRRPTGPPVGVARRHRRGRPAPSWIIQRGTVRRSFRVERRLILPGPQDRSPSLPCPLYRRRSSFPGP